MATPDEILRALDAAFAQDWTRTLELLAHLEGDDMTAWLAGIALKALGQESAARDLYVLAGRPSELFDDPKIELRAVHHEIVHERRGE